MRNRTRWAGRACSLGVAAGWRSRAGGRAACTPSPEVFDPDLAVSAAVTGLSQPVSMAFLGEDDMLVLEKASGQVKRVVRGEVRDVVLDLAVNSASERGLLGIALHPKFRRNGWVYLFWSESRSGVDSATSPTCGCSATGSTASSGTARRSSSTATSSRSALQDDATNRCAGNHDGGVLRFGPDGKLYAIVGDTGRRGRRRTSPRAVRRRASTTTSSAVPRPTTRTARA